MVRLVAFDFNDVGNTKMALATMTWREAEKFVEEGKSLLERKDVSSAEWLNRTLETVAQSISKGSTGITVEELKDRYDMPTINAMYLKILEASGLRTVEPGGAGAVSISRGSAAA